jgi:hypothetical protein
MSRFVINLNSQKSREKAIEWIRKAPSGFRVTFQEPKRSTDQNARLWAMLTAVSVQVEWHGQRLSPEDWKLIFMAGLNQELRMVPNLQGNGFVQLGRSSSNLSKSEFGDLMELIDMFAAEKGIDLWQTKQKEEA